MMVCREGMERRLSLQEHREHIRRMSPRELAKFYKEAMRAQEDEFDRMMDVTPRVVMPESSGVAVEWIHAMSGFYSRAIQRTHYRLMLEQKLGFIEAYQVSVDSFLSKRSHHIENGSMLGSQAIKSVFHLLYERLKRRYEIMILSHLHTREHFAFCKNVENPILIEEDTGKDMHPALKIHITSNALIPSSSIRWDPKVSGICVARTEMLYRMWGTLPSVDTFESFFVEWFQITSGKELFIVLPDIRPKRFIPLLNHHYTDLHFYDQYPAIIDHLVKGMARAMKQTGKIPKIVIPMIRMANEVPAWKTILECLFEHESTPVPDIGILIETESALEYHEDFQKMPFVMIGLNQLAEELDDQHPGMKMTFSRLQSLFWRDLKDIHQHFRAYSTATRHIVMGDMLADPVILSKMIAAGFKEFAIPLDALSIARSVMERHHRSRGRYRGVHAKRKQKFK